MTAQHGSEDGSVDPAVALVGGGYDSAPFRLATRHGKGTAKLSVALAVGLALAGCGASESLPRTDGEKLVQATLGMLSGNGAPLCVDARTVGRPLAVFRSITLNPPRGSRPPDWYVPDLLKPPPPVPSGVLVRSARGDGTVQIDQPTNATAPLPPRVQARLNRAANSLSLQAADQTVTILPSWKSGIKARWWLRNRISRHCSPNYQISNPVTAANIGYVSVKGEHWGTTYAFARRESGWVATAQWRNWLY